MKEEILFNNNGQYNINDKKLQEEENFLNYILQNYETINSLTMSIDWMSFLSISFFTIFLLGLTLRTILNYSIFVSFGFLFIAIIFVILQVNFLLRIKMILDDFENEKSSSTPMSNTSSLNFFEKQFSNKNLSNKNSPKDLSSTNLRKDSSSNKSLKSSFEKKSISNISITNFGSLITLICFNLVAVNLLVFFVLLSIKINVPEIIKFDLILIPLYIGIITSLFYLIYILPGLIDKKYFSDIILYILTFICLVIFIILLNDKIDEKLNQYKTWLHVFIPLIGWTVIFIGYISYNFSTYSSNMHFILQLSGCLIILISETLLGLTIDKSFKIHSCFSGFLFITGFLLFTFQKIINFFSDGDNNSNSNKNYENQLGNSNSNNQSNNISNSNLKSNSGIINENNGSKRLNKDDN